VLSAKGYFTAVHLGDEARTTMSSLGVVVRVVD
jgi:hypothetical protein